MTVRILFAHHSRSGGTAEVVTAVLAGMSHPDLGDVIVDHHDVADVGVDHLRAADGFVLATPVRFGGVAGLTRDLLERLYYPCLGITAGMPYALAVRGTTDASGAVRDVQRIVAGLGWQAIRPPLTVEHGEAGLVHQPGLPPVELERCTDWGAEVAAAIALSRGS